MRQADRTVEFPQTKLFVVVFCRGLNDRLRAQSFVFDQPFQCYEKDKFVLVRTALYSWYRACTVVSLKYESAFTVCYKCIEIILVFQHSDLMNFILWYHGTKPTFRLE